MSGFQAFCPVFLLSSPLLKQPMSTCQLLYTYCLQASSIIFRLLLWPLSGSPHALGSSLLLSTGPGIQRPSPGFSQERIPHSWLYLRGIAFQVLYCSLTPITLLWIWVPCSLHLPFTVPFLLYLVIDLVTDDFLSLSKAMQTCPLQATISAHPHPWKSHFISLLESLWLFSKPCFMLQQNDASQKNGMMAVVLLVSEDRQRSLHFRENSLRGLALQPWSTFTPTCFLYQNPTGFLSFPQKCHAICFLHRTFTNILSFAWNVIFSALTILLFLYLITTQELLPWWRCS